MTSADEYYTKLERDIKILNDRKIKAKQFLELLIECPGCHNHIEFNLSGTCPICDMRVHIDENFVAHPIDPVVFET